jgi:hypothetical protein
LVEHDVLAPDRPLVGEGPVVETQLLGELIDAAFVERGAVRGRESLAAPVAEKRLGRPEVVPVGLRLDADPCDGDELALDTEQRLDDPSDCS